MSLRHFAATLDLAPNAIYRYFSDRSTLEDALANEAARQLELVLRKAADGCEPVTAIRKMSSAYMKFARRCLRVRGQCEAASEDSGWCHFDKDVCSRQ